MTPAQIAELIAKALEPLVSRIEALEARKDELRSQQDVDAQKDELGTIPATVPRGQ